MKPHYDSVVVDWGSLEVLLAHHAFIVCGKEAYDRDVELADFIADVVSPLFSADSYYAALYDPAAEPYCQENYENLHIAVRLWQKQGWNCDFEPDCDSSTTVAKLAADLLEEGLRCLVLSGDERLLELVHPDLDLFLLEDSRSGEVCMDDASVDRLAVLKSHCTSI